jgi:hypothetical protein
LAEEAERLDAELDAANVPEADLDDFIGGVGSMPTDEEVRLAREEAEKNGKGKQLR